MTSPGEVAALIVGLIIAARLAWPSRKVIMVLGLLVVASLTAYSTRREPLAQEVPRATGGLGFVSSKACLGCHPGQHASFSRSFHRTMTQAATLDAILAPLDGSHLERRGDAVWVKIPDPDLVIENKPAPIVERQVVMTTGSHREQAFWVAGRRPGDLRLAPFVWMTREAAFVDRRDAFILPPSAPMPPVRWGSSCIACHAVAGEPRHDLQRDSFDTRVGELGVACEACHGPGAAHVDRYRDPFVRYQSHRASAPDATITNPKRLTPPRSVAVCGQCHAYSFPKDEAEFWTSGYSKSFRAGEPLEPSRTILRPETWGVPGAPVIEASAASLFWSDGSVRVGGREYNSLTTSACYTRGRGDRTATCLSCHAMHEGEPAGQIAPSRAADAMCTTCHEDHAAETHTHHAPSSVGSACVACHMPKTSFALLSAVRSHRIDSPTTTPLGQRERPPNACNLCHLDRSLAWTSEVLGRWYGARSGVVDDQVPFGLRFGLAGDAGVRALIADALGSSEARAAGVDGRSILEHLIDDPYAAVRFVARRSRRRITSRAAPAPLDVGLVRTMLAERDERAVTIAE